MCPLTSSSSESSGLEPSSSSQTFGSAKPSSTAIFPVSGKWFPSDVFESEVETNSERLSADPVTCFDATTGKARYVHGLREEFDSDRFPRCGPSLKVCPLPLSGYTDVRENVGQGETDEAEDENGGDEVVAEGESVDDEAHDSDVDQAEAEGEGLTGADAEGGDEGEDEVMIEPGKLDEGWRRQMAAVDGESIANRIYHIPDGYHLHLPPPDSSVHEPPEGHAVVYLRY